MHLLRRIPLLGSITVAVLALLLLAQIAVGWTGPTTTPPTGNVNSPINTGTTDQTKNASLGVNGLAVFGNGIMSGSNRYLNWGSTSGSSGYGLRDNGGTMKFKDNGGNWISFAGGLGWTPSGSDLYLTTSGNVGIGTTNPASKLDVDGAIRSAAKTNSASLSDALPNPDAVQYGFAAAHSSDGGGIFPWYQGESDHTDLAIWYGDDSNVDLRFLKGTWDGANQDLTDIMTLSGGGNVGIGTTNPLQKLHVNGTITAAAFIYSSDERLKENISPLEVGLLAVSKLRPVSFTWKKDSGVQGGQDDIGFIAQDVEKIVPEAVQTDIEGMKSIDYPKLVPILVKAIQEQQADNDRQQEEIQALQAQVRALRRE